MAPPRRSYGSERSRDWSYPRSDGPFRVRKKKARDDKSPAIAYCGNCKGARFQTIIGSRSNPRPPAILKCNGCQCINAYEGGQLAYFGVIGTKQYVDSLAKYQKECANI